MQSHVSWLKFNSSISTNSNQVVVLTASTSISGKKHGRGPTRGKGVDKLRKHLGHPIPVEINREAMEMDGEFATQAANAIGQNIRDHAPVRDISWDAIDFGIRESIIMRVGVI